MRILLVAIHYPVASGRYALDALRRMGHDVRTVGPQPDPPNMIWGHLVDERHIWEPSNHGTFKNWEPDLVLCMDAHIMFERSGKMPHVVYGVDNHVRDYRQNKWEWDHLFLAHGGGQRMGEDNVSWLPCGYDPTLFKTGKDWDERAYDVAHIGVTYPQREALLYALHAALPPSRKLAYGWGVIGKDYAGVYQDARISLVRSAQNDVAMRVWETAACGCLVVMDEVHDCEPLGLEHAKNCLLYRTGQEATDLVLWALAHPDEAQTIAKAGQRWAKGGTWENRLKEIVLWYDTRDGKAVEKEKTEDE